MNQAGANIAVLAANLGSWLQLAALPDGQKARGRDIKRWHYRLFATAGKIITRARRNYLLLLEAIGQIAAAANRPAVLLLT